MEAAIIKKMATDRLKDQLIKAVYSADEVNTWDRDRAEAMTLEERKLIAQEEEIALRKQERVDSLKTEEAKLKREDTERR